MTVANLMPYECPICGKRLAKHTHLRLHLEQHHPRDVYNLAEWLLTLP